MKSKPPAILAYLVMLALSLPVPLLHHYQTDRVIETMRPAIRLEDGSWAPMLMPITILLLRHLGQLSGFLPFIILTLLFLSFRRAELNRPTVVLFLVVCLCAFTTFYAFYSTLLLGAIRLGK